MSAGASEQLRHGEPGDSRTHDDDPHRIGLRRVDLLGEGCRRRAWRLSRIGWLDQVVHNTTLAQVDHPVQCLICLRCGSADGTADDAGTSAPARSTSRPRSSLVAGYERASLNRIVKSCGLSKSSFYHFVASKQELFGLVRGRHRSSTSRGGSGSDAREPGRPAVLGRSRSASMVRLARLSQDDERFRPGRPDVLPPRLRRGNATTPSRRRERDRILADRGAGSRTRRAEPYGQTCRRPCRTD